MDPKQFNEETRKYFNSLPPMIQEDLIQSNVQTSGKEELQRIAEHLLQRD